ncbi:hypothetical protein N9901_02135 [Flavobacteriaceae bacterium]|nr:hypothetical protein [Flavobacteriaceae bacterium]
MKKFILFITNENVFAVMLTFSVIAMITLLKYQDIQEKNEASQKVVKTEFNYNDSPDLISFID